MLQGKRVVRLKGGCPSTFSRVSGEMAALAAAGTPFQLVPGVSSALAAPLLAGARHSAFVTSACRSVLEASGGPQAASITAATAERNSHGLQAFR